MYDIDTCRVIHANAAACALWHAKDEQDLKSRDMSVDMTATVATRLKQYQADFTAHDAVFTELWTLFPNGTPTTIKIQFSGFRLLDGRMAMQCEALGDTDQNPDNLRSTEALLHTDVMISLFGADGPALYMNPAARKVVLDANSTLRQIFICQSEYDVIAAQLRDTGEHRLIAEMLTKNGNRWFDISAKKCDDAATGEPAVLVTAIDVTELKLTRDQARFLANRDQLTGCYNRSYLLEHISALARKGARHIALLYFDVDRFKQINDTFGHVIGDQVLIELSDRAIDRAQEGDIVVRLGGDEFVVVVNLVDPDKGRARAAQFFDDLSQPLDVGPDAISAKVSIGVSVFNPAQTEIETALRQADIALYLAKNAGRNRFLFYDEKMGAEIEARKRIEAEIDVALSEHQFDLHYQPRLDVRTGKITAVEGLARWRHPSRGLVLPDDFIPICEDTGLIHALGRQVLEMGFSQAIEWHKAGLDLCLSLNISPRQLLGSDLMSTLKAHADRPDFPTHKIELEITERALIEDQEGAAVQLQAISDLGFKISIDDFGSGYSNLAYISRFPLNCLKIDRSFIGQWPTSGPIIRLILALAQQLDVNVVAEGVETQAQFDWLRDEGCTQIQGFLVGKPVSADDLLPLLHKSVPQRVVPGLP